MCVNKCRSTVNSWCATAQRILNIATKGGVECVNRCRPTVNSWCAAKLLQSAQGILNSALYRPIVNMLAFSVCSENTAAQYCTMSSTSVTVGVLNEGVVLIALN